MESQMLRVVVFKEEDLFVAQCLEHDICVQADDMATLSRRFAATVVLEDVESLAASPQHFHDMWDAGIELAAHLDHADVRLAA